MNTIVYAEDWAIKLQERLSEVLKWKQICRVEYTDTKVLHNPYLTDAVVQVGTRGSAYTQQAIVETDDNVTIDTFKILPQLIDRADLAQSTYMRQMEMADTQGVLLNEVIETDMMAQYASWTAMGDDGTGKLILGATPIAVTASNVDDIIRGVKREIRKANGETFAFRYGIFIVWRPQDFELLEAYVQANGFVTSDKGLEDGIEEGFRYMGVSHYSSNKYTAGHLFAGVKNIFHLGICKSTYGQIVVDNEPATSGGAVSGVGIISRIDYKFKAWFKTVPILFNINVV